MNDDPLIPPTWLRLARVASALTIVIASGAGIVLLAQGMRQGVVLILSAGILGALYARCVLNWQPSDVDDDSV